MASRRTVPQSCRVPQRQRVFPSKLTDRRYRIVVGVRRSCGAPLLNGQTIRVSVGSDPSGYAVKRKVVELAHRFGYTVQDLGTGTEDAIYAYAVGQAIARAECDCGILICGGGQTLLAPIQW